MHSRIHMAYFDPFHFPCLSLPLTLIYSVIIRDEEAPEKFLESISSIELLITQNPEMVIKLFVFLLNLLRQLSLGGVLPTIFMEQELLSGI